jgi:hypothetical protein
MKESVLDGLNGSEQVPTRIVRTVIPDGPGRKLIYTQSDGMYVGTIRIEGMTFEGLKLMLQDAQNYVAETTGGIAVASHLPPGAQRQ